MTIPFLISNSGIFIKNGFQVVDSVKPDFELLIKKFDFKSKNPEFKSNMMDNLNKYRKGLFVIRSPQCPYTEKNVNAILDTAQKKFNLKPTLVELKNSNDVQDNPCAFGSFCIIFDGEIISHHPISNTRFENIMNKKIKITK